MGSTSVSADMVTSYTRAFLPLALIVTGLVIALVGASSVACGDIAIVEQSSAFGNTTTETATPGSPWGFVVVGGLVFGAGCFMQIASWRLAGRAGEAAKATEPLRSVAQTTPEGGGGGLQQAAPVRG